MVSAFRAVTEQIPLAALWFPLARLPADRQLWDFPSRPPPVAAAPAYCMFSACGPGRVLRIDPVGPDGFRIPHRRQWDEVTAIGHLDFGETLCVDHVGLLDDAVFV
jgi:hypothetical protein